MQKKLLVLGGVLVGGLFIIAILNSTLNARHSPSGVCESFIAHILNNEPAKAYSLFSPAATQQISSASWQKTAGDLQAVYTDKGVVKKVSEADTLNPSTSVPESQISYLLTNTSQKYAITCSTTKSGKRVLIDGYTSHLKE